MMTSRRATALGFGLLIALTGCSSAESPPQVQDVIEYTDGSGPLGASPGGPGDSGGMSLLPPAGAGEWDATFGAMLLCTRSAGPITLKDVAVRLPSGQSQRASSRVRVVDQDASRERGDDSPIGSMVGEPEGVVSGLFLPSKGFKVSRECPAEPGAFDELLVTLPVSPAGIEEAQVAIDYSVDGRTERTVLPWLFTACGSEVSAPDMC